MPNLIDDFIAHNEGLLEFNDDFNLDYSLSDEDFERFRLYLIQNNFNFVLGQKLADTLQLLNSEKNFSDFTLYDLKKLFEFLIKMQRFNLETYLEAAFFESNVLNNKDEAIRIINIGLKNSEAKIGELKALLKELNTKDQ